MDIIRQLNEILWSSEEDDDFVGEDGRRAQQRAGRRVYHTLQRAVVDDFDEVEFHRYFRLKKESFWTLHAMVRERIDGDPRRSRELRAEHKLLACGNFQQTAGDYIGISQSTVCRILPEVCAAILEHRRNIIYMPHNENEMRQRAAEFASISDFPRCIGAIDSPGGEISEAFRNRHGYFSMNVQGVCDANLKFQNIVARWAGSTHDQTIFDHSTLQEQLSASQFGEYVLIGD